VRGRTVIVIVFALLAAGCGARLTKAQIAAADRGGVSSAGVSNGFAAGGAATPGVSGAASATGANGASVLPGSAPAAAPGGGAPAGTGVAASANVAPPPPGGNGGATDVGVTATTIELGNVSTLTGPVPGLFKGAVDGAQAYIAYQNSLGGVYGRQLHLQVGDDALDASTNKQKVDELIPRVLGFLGSFSVNDQAGAQDMQNAGVPDVGYSLSHARGDIAVNFSPQPLGHGWRLGPLAHFKAEFGQDVITHIAYFTEDVQSAIDVATAQKAAMASLGYKIVYSRTLEPNEANFTGDVLNMQNAHVKGLMLSGDVGTMSRMAKAMKQQGFSIPFPNWGASAYDPAFIPGSSGGAEGSVLDQQLALYQGEDASSVPEVALFLKWLHQVAPGDNADIFAAFSWAAGSLLVQALKAAGPHLTRKALLSALGNIHQFSDNGFVAQADPGSKGPPTCYLIIRVTGGRFVRSEDPPSAYRCGDGGYFKTG
jgi:ABC-type branched-subunit amino acid transport system substrate-binding protein